MIELTKVNVTKTKCTTVNLRPYGTRRMRLTAPMHNVITTEEDGDINIVVATNYVSDGRSGGLLIDILLPHWGNEKYAQAVITHDALYSSGKVTKKVADIIFLFMLEEAGIGRFRRWAGLRGVKTWFGRRAYNTQDEQDKLNKGLVTVHWGKDG